MPRYKLLIAYDGTHYAGWQVQPNALTIQEVIEKTLQQFLGEPIRIIGSGRTDTGVHALEQVAHFDIEQELDLRKFMAASNGILPRDIRILSIEEVDKAFHAQFSATGKIYHYHLWLDPVQDPFKRLYSTYFPFRCNLDLFKAGANKFIGTHDFTSFANSAHQGSAAKNPVRTIRRLDVIKQAGGIRLEFEGDGFLYKMVRNITGMLMEIASGKLSLDEIDKTFAAKNRSASGVAAPPQGLFLMKVFYD